jgi:hypothetical protein
MYSLGSFKKVIHLKLFTLNVFESITLYGNFWHFYGGKLKYLQLIKNTCS